MPSEFELIARHFLHPISHTILGGGDDCAVFAPRPESQILVSTDMLVCGTHFLPDAEPWGLGWKAAAVNLSDIAAMGGQPRWITLALSLPRADEAWVAPFAQGFAACCYAYDTDWIGGDTTRGPLTLCATVFGESPGGLVICREGAQEGDLLWVSGQPGRAALGLAHLLEGVPLAAGEAERCLAALHRPEPRVALGMALRGIAHAMLDVSDGLLGDLAHILDASQVGAVIEDINLPLAPLLSACGDEARARQCLLSGGDDYELLFTAPPDATAALNALAIQLDLRLTRIGRIVAQRGCWLEDAAGRLETVSTCGYDHFAHR